MNEGFLDSLPAHQHSHGYVPMLKALVEPPPPPHTHTHTRTHARTHIHTRKKTIKPNLDTSPPLFQKTSISALASFKCPAAALTGRSRVCAEGNQLQATPVAQFYFSEFMDFCTLQSTDKMKRRVPVSCATIRFFFLAIKFMNVIQNHLLCVNGHKSNLKTHIQPKLQ